MIKSEFKDKCDMCKTWQFNCHGYKNMILCPDCIQKQKETKNDKKTNQNQLNILYFSEKLSHISHTINDIM